MIKNEYLFKNYKCVKFIETSAQSKHTATNLFCMIQKFFICSKNNCAVYDFRIWLKSPKVETTFPLLYPVLLRTWIIRFPQLFPICKPYLRDTSLGGSQNRNLYLGAISRPLFSQKRSITDDWRGPKYALLIIKQYYFHN